MKYKLPHILLLLGILLFAPKAWAQEDKVAQRRWEIGLNTIPIVKPNNFLRRKEEQFAFLVRKATQTNTHAFRLGFTPGFKYNKSVDHPKLRGVEFFKAGIDLGIEKRHRIGRYFQGYYGADLNFMYRYELQTEALSQNILPYVFFVNEINRIRAGVSGVVGINYDLGSRLSLSAESHLALFSSRETDKIYQKNSDNFILSDPRLSQDSQYYSMELKPIAGLYLSYRF